MGAAAGRTCCSTGADQFDAAGSDAIGVLSDEKLALRAKEPLQADEIALVQKTWSRILELGPEKVGVALFKNIFKLAPEALKLFSFKAEPNVLTYETPGLKAHAVRVIGVLGLAITGLHNLKSLKITLQELGLRHYGYGVRRAHYDVVGKALMMLLDAAFREAFSTKVRLAWAKVWCIVSQNMLASAPNSDDHPGAAELPKAAANSSGPLSDADIALAKKSWSTAKTLGVEAVGVLLFRHIFRIAPEALQLFPFRDEVNLFESARLKAHATKVVSTVDVAISGLTNLEELSVTLDGLGRRHMIFGVLPPHYDVVGQALIATLRDGLGKAFTPELEAVWLKVWTIVSTSMTKNNY